MSTVPIDTTRDDATRALEHRIARVCGHLNALHAELASLAADALAGGLWEQWGIRSPEHWLAWQAGLSPARARHLVHIARRLPELPETGAAFAAGELSVDQMTVVARHAPAYTDREVCQLAKAATVTQLSVALSRYAHPEPDDSREPKPEPVTGNDPRDHLSASFDDGGRYRLNVECDAANGAIIDKALAEARDHLFQNGNAHVTGVEALVEMARRSLGAADGPSRRELFRAFLHVDTDGDGGPAHAWLNGGPQLPTALRDALLCDGVVVPLWKTEGRPVNVGRSRRTVPAHTRRLILDRDRTCRHPSCTSTRHLEVHHLQHWLHGGPTDTDNLLALCPHHHDAHHRGAFTISGTPDEPGSLQFFDARGRPIPNAAQPHPPNGPPPPAPPYVHPSGEPMSTTWLYFNHAAHPSPTYW